ncbi:MAG: hypothetical protein HZB55_21605 [Deltaproteobacteria bacterium]|nr:hypothetical protein [Deltaproteobacteria bacterium]
MPGRSSNGRHPQGTEQPEGRWRLALYRRVAASLGDFFQRYTAPFCARCLEVTRRHHCGDPRADVDLVEGIFPGCCHAGVGDALWVPRSGDEGRFPPDLAQAVNLARTTLPPGSAEPLAYRVRERQTGVVARGVACVHLGPGGCRLGDLRGPLCVAYLCEPVRAALAAAVGPELLGSDTDDFCGALEVLRATVSEDEAAGEASAAELEARLATLGRRLERWERTAGATLYSAYASSRNDASPSVSTR